MTTISSLLFYKIKMTGWDQKQIVFTFTSFILVYVYVLYNILRLLR